MLNKAVILGLAALGLASASAASATQFAVNGSFEAANPTSGVLGLGFGTDSTSITGWTLVGHGFCCGLAWYYPTGTADNNNVTAQIYGPQNGSNNGFGLSPDGGAMVALDGAATFQAEIQQSISGLAVGNTYHLSFYWGGGQQYGFGGATTEKFTYGFGADSFDTVTVANPEAGWSGWQHVTHSFTATSSTQVLSFLATGTPDGQPPFSVLDGVSLTGGVPEAATWAMLVAGFGLVGAAARRRHAAVA